MVMDKSPTNLIEAVINWYDHRPRPLIDGSKESRDD